MEGTSDIIHLVLVVLALILAIAWAVFPFVVVGKLNRTLKAMEKEIKETIVWQKTADDSRPDVDEVPPRQN